VISGLDHAIKIAKRKDKGKGKTEQQDDEDLYAGIMDHEFRHAAFADRIPETMPKWGLGNRRSEMVRGSVQTHMSEDKAGGDSSRISYDPFFRSRYTSPNPKRFSEFTPERVGEPERPSKGVKISRKNRGFMTPSPSPERQSEVPQDFLERMDGQGAPPSNGEQRTFADPLAEFYAVARAERENSVSFTVPIAYDPSSNVHFCIVATSWPWRRIRFRRGVR
jgi:hypothetical protein